MKNELEKLIREKCDELKIDGSKNGLRLEWVDENNYSFYFKGIKYTPDEFNDGKGFLDSILLGKELSNDKRMEKLIKKQAKDALKKEEYDAQNGKGSKQNDEGKKDENDDEEKGNEKKDEGKKDEKDIEEPVVEVEKLEEEQPVEEPVRKGRGRPPKNS